MDPLKLMLLHRSKVELQEAVRTLEMTIREAGECLLDLQLAVQALQLAMDTTLARDVDVESRSALRDAMRR